MSTTAVDTSGSTITSLGMADPPMGSSASRLCWPSARENDTCSDRHSKWIEAVCTPSATSSAVIEELRTLFAQFGIPETTVSDNGSCFVSAEFEAFLENNSIKHITSAPYHPASNGLAERAVQIVKRGLRKITQGSIRSRLAKTLFSYRLTPQTTTGISPGELLLGRRPRSRLDLLKPHTAERVERKQLKQKERHDSKSRES